MNTEETQVQEEREPTEQEIQAQMENEMKYLKKMMPLWRLRHERQKLIGEAAQYKVMEMRSWSELAHMEHETREAMKLDEEAANKAEETRQPQGTEENATATS